MAPRIRPFADLKPRIQAKIERPPEANEVTHHWMWKGAVTPARVRIPVVPAGRVHRLEERKLQRQRATPNVQSTEHGYPVPAYRRIWCDLTGTDYARMPEVTRCPEDLCVNPWHLLTRKKHRLSSTLVRPEPDYRPRPPKESVEQIWNTLTNKKPNPDLSLASAADEIGITSLDPETWAQYQTWCIDNYDYPEEDD